MSQWVEIGFDCLPLRSVTRLDIPIDASPKFRARCESIKRAIETHGSHNSYFLYNARCGFHLTNHPQIGSISFRFQGTLLTDSDDIRAVRADLEVDLEGETCDWLTQSDVEFFRRSVSHALLAEFDRYIDAGDLARTKQRVELLQSQTDQSGGYLGMYL
ncbi:MAG: hypothetical protein FJ295_20355 [Planctomycetes bacterium]|nr:hypothetical protein [Planctomycetota bacterium]